MSPVHVSLGKMWPLRLSVQLFLGQGLFGGRTLKDFFSEGSRVALVSVPVHKLLAKREICTQHVDNLTRLIHLDEMVKINTLLM